MAKKKRAAKRAPRPPRGGTATRREVAQEMERVAKNLKIPRWLADAIDARRATQGVGLGFAQQVIADLLELPYYKRALRAVNGEGEA